MAALVKYKYLGLSTVVEVDYPTPQVKLSLHAPGSPPTYPGLDRFGRVINHPWINYGASPEEDVARIQHGYDRNSNRLWRQNDVARALSKKFDQQYIYDGLNRLTDAKTGLLNGSHIIPPGSDTRFQQQWSLDYVGNWSCFKQDDDGGGTFDLDQTRTANPVNEITNISATTGPTWATPQYDPAGNTTSFPKPADPTESFTAVYDAWNRMVKVIDNETDGIVQENVYDGRNFRIVKKTYDAGVLDETRHIYYTSSWQAIEERLGTDPDSADAAQQYVWGIRYIDDLVLRDRDTSEPPDGVLNERLYYTNDTQFNVTTLVGVAGAVLERYEYDAYGSLTTLDADFDSISGNLSNYDNEVSFRGFIEDMQIHLTNSRTRIWITSLGRFAQRDVAGYADGQSLYAGYFVMHDGLDPFGLRYDDGLDRFRLCDRCGPDVTDWFMKDLTVHIQAAIANQQLFGMSSTWSFYYQAKYDLSYKWMDFSTNNCGKGRCVHTVQLGGVCIRKNQLGNIAFGVIATLAPPRNPLDIHGKYGGYYTTEQAIKKGYDAGPTYKADHPHSSNYGAFADKPRIDNLAAFGVGYSLASLITSRVISMSPGNLNGVFVGSLMNNSSVLNKFNTIGVHSRTIPPLTKSDLTFIPEFGGFDTRNCLSCGETRPVNSLSSTGRASDLEVLFRGYSGKLGFDDWLKETFEDYSH